MTDPTKENYQYITAHTAKNYSLGRQGQKVNYIVLHHWGAKGQKFDNIINWFCYNPNCQTSAHYVVEAGKVACIVDLKDTAYHAGNWLYNLQSIGIECRPEATEADYQTVAQLIAKIWKHYGILELIVHRDVPGAYTSCPGIWDINKLNKLAHAYYKGEVIAPMKKKDIEQPSDWAKQAWQKFKALGFFDGRRPKDVATREEVITINAKVYDALKADVEQLKAEVAELKKEGK